MKRNSIASLIAARFACASTNVNAQSAVALSGGYKAVFTLESGFNLNNGTLGQGGRLFGRKAFVGISTPYGTVTLGRHQNLHYELMYKYDPLTLQP